MFDPKFYQPESLIEIQREHKYKNHPELYLKRQIIYNERDLIKQIIYMVSGLQTNLFVKIYDQVQFDSQKGQVQKVFHYGLRQDCRSVFTHLSHQTIKSCIQNPLKIANLMHYLNSKSKLMYKKTNNIILKSFSEGILSYITHTISQITKILTQFQKQCGNITCMYDESLQNKQTKQLTLLKVSYIFQQKNHFLTQIVNTLSKILPYMMGSNSQNSPDNYLSIQILFDQFSKHMNSIQLSQTQKQQILSIYRCSLLIYTRLIQNWISMNPYVLQTQNKIPFFIKLSDINFSLSRAKYDQFTAKHNLTAAQMKQNEKNQQFIQLFFKLNNLLVDEYLPEMFKKQGSCILQLGKIIQFIYLYFSTQQRPFLSQFFSVQAQFAKIYDLINGQINQKNHNNEKSMFLTNQIKKNRKKPSSISSRIQKLKPNKLRIIKEQNNSFQNFTTRGIFYQDENINANFKNQTNLLQYAKDKISKQSSFSRPSKILPEHPHLQKVQNFQIKFQRILSQIIQKLYQKALFFFQQQSQKQFFKLNSHIEFFSITQLHKKSSIRFMNQTSMKMIQQNLDNVQNSQRIISSISLTLIGIKKFMLFQQGDFFIQLVSLVNNLFENSYTKISKNVINSYIQEAIKSSSANDLPSNIKQKVSFMFIKKIKDQQIKQLKAWNIFSILFKPDFPVNCIFTNQIMENFGQVFNFIFNIKKCQHLLKNVWEEFKENAKIQTQYSLFQTKRHPFESKILAIRNNIHHFVNVIFGFIMISIQSYWQEYINSINLSFSRNNFPSQFNQQIKNKNNKKLHNPISLIQLTLKLQKNLKLQTTQNLTLSNTMILISQLLSKYKKLLKIQPQSKQWNDVLFKQDIQYIQHQFLGIMEIAKNIQGVGEAISYNYQVR